MKKSLTPKRTKAPTYWYACKVHLTNGTKTIRLYKRDTPNGARTVAMVRSDAEACDTPVRISDAEYEELIKMYPPSPRNTRQKSPS